MIMKTEKWTDFFINWDEMVEKIVCVGKVEAASRPAVKKALSALENVPQGIIDESGMSYNRHAVTCNKDTLLLLYPITYPVVSSYSNS